MIKSDNGFSLFKTFSNFLEIQKNVSQVSPKSKKWETKLDVMLVR